MKIIRCDDGPIDTTVIFSSIIHFISFIQHTSIDPAEQQYTPFFSSPIFQGIFQGMHKGHGENVYGTFVRFGTLQNSGT